MKTMKVWGVIASAAVATVLFTNASSSDDACSKDAVCRQIIKAISDARKEGSGLSDAQVIAHMASRLGYGVNPIENHYQSDVAEPVRVRNMAYHLAVQIKAGRGDSIQLRTAIGEVAPLVAKSISQVGLEREAARARNAAAQAKLQKDIDDGVLTVRDELFCETNLADPYCKRVAHLRALQKEVLAFSQQHVTQQQRRADLLRMTFGSQMENDARVVRDVQINLEAVLLEFWSNHFNIDYLKSGTFAMGSNGYSAVIRSRMRSDFQTLLTSVITNPGMIHYLDNQTNSYNTSTRAANNQNLGRELLELHTLGIGPRAAGTPNSPYTQNDVEGASAILTGNTYISRVEGDRYVIKGVFNKLAHIPHEIKVGTSMVPIAAPKVMGKVYSHSLTKGSSGDQTVLPSSYNGQLMALLGDLAAHNRTKISICTKLARRFVAGPDLVDVRNACIIAYGNNGDLKAMYTAILAHKSFWDIKNFRNQIKNPVEQVVSLARAQGLNIRDLNLAPAVSPAGVERAFSHHIASRLDMSVSSLGLALRAYAFPTGYNNYGRMWLSKGYLTQSVVQGFQLSNFYESYSSRVSSRLATQANEATFAAFPDRKSRDAFLFAKAFRRPSSAGLSMAESTTMMSISDNTAKQDSYKVAGQAKLSEMRTAMELAQASRFAILK